MDSVAQTGLDKNNKALELGGSAAHVSLTHTAKITTILILKSLIIPSINGENKANKYESEIVRTHPKFYQF